MLSAAVLESSSSAVGAAAAAAGAVSIGTDIGSSRGSSPGPTAAAARSAFANTTSPAATAVAQQLAAAPGANSRALADSGALCALASVFRLDEAADGHLLVTALAWDQDLPDSGEVRQQSA